MTWLHGALIGYWVMEGDEQKSLVFFSDLPALLGSCGTVFHDFESVPHNEHVYIRRSITMCPLQFQND